ncbi:MAG: sigma-70 family RNA polymerase sigma factor [Bacteroidota bacterium]|nr:sigma-70 family RNA polymerase sigma factor [Bacteroidota bacterium]
MALGTSVNNEQELLRLISKGDEKAFAAIYEIYRQPLYTFLLRIVKSDVIAEDILADVFMKIWIGRELAVEIKNIEAFLKKVAYNKAMDFFNVAARRRRLQDVYKKNFPPEGQMVPDEQLIDGETRKILLDAVNKLPPQRKLIYTLSREHGLSHEEIANVLHLSRNTVKNSITTAARSISEYLRKNYGPKTALIIFFHLV